MCGLAGAWAVALLAISLTLGGDVGIGYALAFIVSGVAVVFINRPIVSLVAGLTRPVGRNQRGKVTQACVLPRAPQQPDSKNGALTG